MTFLREFVDYLKTRTDCPPDFHLHAGMAALSLALGNRVWCDGWTRDIHPNLWTVIIAPSGFGKSAPLDMAQSIATKAGLGDHVLPSSFSQESLFDCLQANQNIGAFFPQEFAAFLGLLSREYNAGARETLTELYDVPEMFRRVLRPKQGVAQETRLQKPFVTILGASSPAWFAETYRANDLKGGFLARFVFCPSDKPGQTVDDPGPRNMQRENALVKHLSLLRQLHGRVDMSSVRPKIVAWDREARAKLQADCPPEFQGMRSRAGLLLRKACMVSMASRDPETMQVTAKDVDFAIHYVERAHADAEHYLSEEVAHNKDDAEALLLLKTVQRKGGRVARSVAMRNVHLGADAMRRAVNTLVESGRVRFENNDLVEVRQPGSHEVREDSQEFAEIRQDSQKFASGYDASASRANGLAGVGAHGHANPRESSRTGANDLN